MSDFLPPVVARLMADSHQFTAEMDKAQAKMGELGAAGQSFGSKFSGFASKASTAVIGFGVAAGGFALDKAYKFSQGLDAIQNQSTATAAQVKALGVAILNISSSTTSSTADLQAAGLAIYQAGYKGAAAIKLLSDAAKLAVTTGTNVTATTQSLIAVQALHFASSKNITAVTGEMLAGSKAYSGGLAAEAALLQGKVGVALLHYQLSLKTAIGLGAVFSRVNLPTRSVSTFVNGLGKLLAPVEKVTFSAGKLHHTISSYAFALAQAGLNQNALAHDLRTGNISGLLDTVRAAAVKTHMGVAELFNLVFGPTAGGVGDLLSKSGAVIKQVQDAMRGSGSKTLQSGFETAMNQMPNKIKRLLNSVEADFVRLGEHLLPAASAVLAWVDWVAKEFKRHPLPFEIVGGAVAGAAIAYKIAQGVSKVMGLFKTSTSAVQVTQGYSQITLLTAIEANTAAIAGTSALGAGAGAGADAALAGRGGVGMIGAFGKYVGVFGAGVIAFEGASKFLSSKEGKKVGNFIIDNNLFGAATIANTVADVLGKRSHPTAVASASTEKYLKSISEWGDYQKMMVANLQANYALAGAYATKIAKAERQRTKVTVNVGTGFHKTGHG